MRTRISFEPQSHLPAPVTLLALPPTPSYHFLCLLFACPQANCRFFCQFPRLKLKTNTGQDPRPVQSAASERRKIVDFILHYARHFLAFLISFRFCTFPYTLFLFFTYSSSGIVRLQSAALLSASPNINSAAHAVTPAWKCERGP